MTEGSPAWQAAVETLLDGTGCIVTGYATRAADPDRLELDVTCLPSTLRFGTETLKLEMRAGTDRWHVASPDGFVRDQRERRTRLQPNDGNRGLQVDLILARRLRRVANRSTARRMLFALSQGTEVRTTDWEDVTHTAMRNGIAFATMALGNDVTWRLGELRLKGRTLPETALTAVRGRMLSNLIDMPMLEGLVMERARNSPEGVVAKCISRTEPYTEVWRDIGGE